jgi:hypothetical protein
MQYRTATLEKPVLHNAQKERAERIAAHKNRQVKFAAAFVADTGHQRVIPGDTALCNTAFL